MNAKSLAVGALRVLSVYILVEGISAIPFLLSSGSSATDHASALISSFGISTVLLPFALGIILWFISPLLARKISDDRNTGSEAGPLSEQAVQRIIFVSLGSYLVVVTVPGLFVRLGDWVLNLNKAAGLMPRGVEFVISDSLRLLLGLALIMGAPFFARVLQRMREFGLPAARDE